jgi:hypothetical protein
MPKQRYSGNDRRKDFMMNHNENFMINHNESVLHLPGIQTGLPDSQSNGLSIELAEPEFLIMNINILDGITF